MTAPQGPGSPYQLLFADDAHESPSLPQTFRDIYPGDWRLPQPREGRPYTYSNFGMSRDGRISFNEPGQEAAVHVTLGAAHDVWLMALLRMRADAVMVGDTTVRLEGEHFWTSDFIYPPDGPAFTAQRQAEGYRQLPMLVILTLKGDVNFAANCFKRNDLHVVVATTNRGAEALSGVRCNAKLDIHAFGDETADLTRMAQMLHSDYGVNNLLCEGGSRVFANMLDAGLIDEEFVTWCPTLVGRSADHPRPSYTEGVPWMPGRSPYSKPLSLHRGEDCIFLRTRVRYP